MSPDPELYLMASLQDDRDRFKAERNRYRKALEEIAALDVIGSGIARAALSAASGGSGPVARATENELRERSDAALTETEASE